MVFRRGAVNLPLSFWKKVFHFSSCNYRWVLVQLEKNKRSNNKMNIQAFHTGFYVLFFAMEYWTGFGSIAWSGKSVLVTLFV